jgi:hypothetical protein
MNSTPKGSAGIALLLLAAAGIARRGPEPVPAASARPRPVAARGAVGKIAAAYPSRMSGWGRAA